MISGSSLTLEAEGEVRGIRGDLESLDSSYIEGIRDIEDQQLILIHGELRDDEQRRGIGGEPQHIIYSVEASEVADLYPVEH